MPSIDSAGTLGAALRAARKRLGLTQSDLALAAGVGLRFVVELERGKPTVRFEQVLRVIDALGGRLTLHGLEGTPTTIEEDRRVDRAARGTDGSPADRGSEGRG